MAAPCGLLRAEHDISAVTDRYKTQHFYLTCGFVRMVLESSDEESDA